MICKVNGVDIRIDGYDVYQRDFELVTVPDFVGKAEDSLVDAIEETDMLDGERITVVLEAEKTKRAEDVKFYFDCFNEDGEISCLYMNCSVYE